MSEGNLPAALRARYREAGQEHVFQGFAGLSPRDQEAFAASLEAVDLDWVAARHAQYRAAETGERAPAGTLEPAPIIRLPRTADAREAATAARRVGEEALRQGRLAAFLVAGGQGTRLGFSGPKGAYPIGPVTDRTLFQIHAEQIQARAERCGCTIPWYVMTSQANDAATRACFDEHGYFGFSPDDVFFFSQEMVPALDFEGRLLLAGPGRLALSPNGHGGSLFALARSGALADMRRRNIDTISYFQVDNPLVTICDPLFAGYHLQAGAEMSSKVLAKAFPEEKVGCICRRDGTLCVIEYSDLDEENMYATKEDGELRFWAGSIAIHMLAVDFVERVAAGTGQLPWHIAIKKVPFYDGLKTVTPTEPNGVKFETFVFDALPLAQGSITMEVERHREFAPVKNPEGVDSVVSCRQLLSDYAAELLAAAGAAVPRDAQGHATAPLELSYRYALDEDRLREKIESGMDLTPGEPLVLD